MLARWWEVRLGSGALFDAGRAHSGAGARARLSFKRLLDIHDDEALFGRRGFRVACRVNQDRLEYIGRTFLHGYREGLFSPPRGPSIEILRLVPVDLRGFAAEGAAMGTAIADALSLRRGRLAAWLQATQASFTYLAHVGVGWALARVPFGHRQVWQKLDPIHRWLAYDGLGFHDTYFYSARVLTGWRRVSGGYRPAAYDQGVGRALWFAGGADVEWAAATIGSFAEHRRPHLWSGLGLALAYAGCSDHVSLALARARAGRFLADLAQGAAFGVAAHLQAGYEPDHARAVLQAFTGLTPAEASALIDDARRRLPRDEDDPLRPRYEEWRAAVKRRVSVNAAALEASH